MPGHNSHLIPTRSVKRQVSKALTKRARKRGGYEAAKAVTRSRRARSTPAGNGSGDESGSDSSSESAGRRTRSPPVRPRLLNSDRSHLLFHVVLVPKPGGRRLLGGDVRPTPGNVRDFDPDPGAAGPAVRFLRRNGLRVVRRGFSLTAAGPGRAVERAFGVKLFRLPAARVGGREYPADQMPWAAAAPDLGLRGAERGVAGLVFPSPVEPAGRPPGPPAGGPTLAVPDGVARAVNAHRVHAGGNRGGGVRAVQIDTGFDWWSHRFFQDHLRAGRLWTSPGYAGRWPGPPLDPSGHGTAVSSLFLSVAPEATLYGFPVTGLCLDDGTPAGDDLYTALDRCLTMAPRPDVVFVPMTRCTLPDPGGPGGGRGAAEAEVALFERAVADLAGNGVVVLFAAGNYPRGDTLPDGGGRWLTASHPLVISVGGVHVTGDRADPAPSEITVSFPSDRYGGADDPDAYVPDVCGPCGRGHDDEYFHLPVPPAANGTWPGRRVGGDREYRATAGGSSGAVAAVAGVAALIRAAHPGLPPDGVRARLRSTATPVPSGLAPVFPVAHPRHDPRTGFGLVDAHAAVTAAEPLDPPVPPA